MNINLLIDNKDVNAARGATFERINPPHQVFASRSRGSGATWSTNGLRRPATLSTSRRGKVTTLVAYAAASRCACSSSCKGR